MSLETTFCVIVHLNYAININTNTNYENKEKYIHVIINLDGR